MESEVDRISLYSSLVLVGRMNAGPKQLVREPRLGQERATSSGRQSPRLSADLSSVEHRAPLLEFGNGMAREQILWEDSKSMVPWYSLLGGVRRGIFFCIGRLRATNTTVARAAQMRSRNSEGQLLELNTYRPWIASRPSDLHLGPDVERHHSQGHLAVGIAWVNERVPIGGFALGQGLLCWRMGRHQRLDLLKHCRKLHATIENEDCGLGVSPSQVPEELIVWRLSKFSGRPDLCTQQ